MRECTLTEARALQRQWRDDAGRLVASGGGEDGSWWMHWSALATFHFGAEGPVLAAAPAGVPRRDIQDIFVRGVLPVVLVSSGYEAFHGSAVAVDDGVAALCARSGTGKSTLALAMAGTGLRHFADDTVAWTVVDGRVVATSLPFPVRVDRSARDAAGVDVSERVPPGAVLPLRRIYQLARDITLDPREPRFEPVPEDRRFEVVLAHAHPFDMGREARRRLFIEHLLKIATAVDVWECRFAPDLNALSVLASRLREHARA